mgnify:CR=1 FL=1
MSGIDQLPPLPVGSFDFSALHKALCAKKPDVEYIDALYIEAAQRPDLLPQVIEAEQKAAAEAAAQVDASAAPEIESAPAAPNEINIEPPVDAGDVQE